MTHDLEVSFEGKMDGDEIAKEDKKSKRRGMLGWFKLRVSSISLEIE